MLAPDPYADGVLQVRILFDGAEADAAQARLIRARVERAVNQLPVATLEFDDGDITLQDFPLASHPRMAPGTAVTVEAGQGGPPEPIFRGVIAGLGLKIGAADTRLVVTCHNAARTMAQGLRSRSFAGLADAEILRTLIVDQGLQADVRGVHGQHGQRSQVGCSDWDFLLALAQANGCVVRVQDGCVQVGPPDDGAAPVLTVGYGTSMLDFDAQLGPGATVDRLSLQGAVRCQGSARAMLGAAIELTGLGRRFSGPACITGLTHTLADGGWITEARFGAPGVAAAALRGLQPGPATLAQNRLVFSDEGGSVRLADPHGNQLVLSAAGLRLESSGDIHLDAKGRIGLQAAGGIELNSPADLNLAGLNVNCSAELGVAARGKASAELSAGGQTTVKGALVMIN